MSESTDRQQKTVIRPPRTGHTFTHLSGRRVGGPSTIPKANQRIENLKGSSDPSYLIFEINVGQRRIRHTTTKCEIA